MTTTSAGATPAPRSLADQACDLAGPLAEHVLSALEGVEPDVQRRTLAEVVVKLQTRENAIVLERLAAEERRCLAEQHHRCGLCRGRVRCCACRGAAHLAETLR